MLSTNKEGGIYSNKEGEEGKNHNGGGILTEDKLKEAITLKSRIDRLKELLSAEGENPMTVGLGMYSPICLEINTDLYRYFITGLHEELNRIEMEFDAL